MTTDKARVRELDALCREAVFRRDGHSCLRCGKHDRLQWCHVYSRRYRSIRWDPQNSMTLCSGCHLWFHHNPADSAEWWLSWAGEAVHKRLRMILKTPRRPDYAAMKLHLEALC